MVSGGSSKLKSPNAPFSDDDLDGESEGVGLKVNRSIRRFFNGWYSWFDPIN